MQRKREKMLIVHTTYSVAYISPWKPNKLYYIVYLNFFFAIKKSVEIQMGLWSGNHFFFLFFSSFYAVDWGKRKLMYLFVFWQNKQFFLVCCCKYSMLYTYTQYMIYIETNYASITLEVGIVAVISRLTIELSYKHLFNYEVNKKQSAYIFTSNVQITSHFFFAS